MQDARRFLSAEEQARVRDAVTAAEKLTSAEIVCALATESGRYDRAESLAGLAGSLLMLAAANAAYVMRLQSQGAWIVGGGLPFAWQCVAVAAGFAAGAALASYVHPVRSLFTTGAEMEAETSRAAQYVFASRGLWRTEGRGGLMLYVSLYEHRVVVLADQGILSQLGQTFVDAVRDTARDALRAGRRLEPFTHAVDQAAGALADALPVRADDRNELRNELLIFHPRA